MLTLRQVIAHAIQREYMSGIDRDKLRVKETGEVFTPDALVIEILSKVRDTSPEMFTDPEKNLMDPCCGDGQFLAWALVFKLTEGKLWKMKSAKFLDSDISEKFKKALKTIHGVELMPDNAELCRNRMLCGQEHLRWIVEKNIVCADALTYDYSFGENESVLT
jgi:type I restriction-modification system DNA methylase subunit